jgi:hypothetical protein
VCLLLLLLPCGALERTQDRSTDTATPVERIQLKRARTERADEHTRSRQVQTARQLTSAESERHKKVLKLRMAAQKKIIDLHATGCVCGTSHPMAQKPR